jgi:hypothetical protein
VVQDQDQRAASELDGPGDPMARIEAYLMRPRDALRGCKVDRMTQDPQVMTQDPQVQVHVSWVRVLGEAIAADQLRDDLDPERLAHTLMAVLQGGYVLARLTGAALRVPVVAGSITDLTVVLRKGASVEDVNAAFREAAGSERLRHYLQYSEAPLVSADIVGNPYSSIFDAPLTEAVGSQVKVFGWYDNEWGFFNRLVEFSERIGAAVA